MIFSWRPDVCVYVCVYVLDFLIFKLHSEKRLDSGIRKMVVVSNFVGL